MFWFFCFHVFSLREGEIKICEGEIIFCEDIFLKCEGVFGYAPKSPFSVRLMRRMAFAQKEFVRA